MQVETVKICDNRDNEVWILDLVDIILSSSPLHQPNDLDHFVLLWIILIWVKKKTILSFMNKQKNIENLVTTNIGYQEFMMKLTSK